MRAKAILQIRIVTGFVLVLSIILLTRLYQIQIVHYDDYVSRAESQYVHTVNDLYNRGSIYFTTKNGERVSAATIQSGFVLAVDPSQINSPMEAYQKISEVYPLDKDTFIRRATLKDRTYVEITSKVSKEEADKIEVLNIEGVQLYRDQWRYYPGGELAARMIGFVGFSGGDNDENPTGRYGLERYYEDVLTRENSRLSVNFFAEIFSNIGSVIFDSTDNRTGDVVTTIEPTVSRILERQLMKTHKKWNSELTGGIVINPKTGAIYALDVIPTFDLNDRSDNTIESFRNPIVEDVYEHGSIIKALTIASGLDSGIITPETTYYDAGFIELNDYTIRNYDGRGRGYVNMQEVLNQSLNTGAAFVADTIGKDLFRDYFLKLKIGSETGIDLPNEVFGLVDNLSSPRDVEYATASFGQGIAFTPIAAVRALSTLGNGGTLITPHIASSIEYQDGTIQDITYPEGERVFSEETSEEISRMLIEVVDKALRGGTVKLDDYTVAAKTGTAQIADKVNGGYYDDRFLHTFFGYFPAYEPEFLIFLYTVEPKQVRYASETLTEPFMELTKFLINYYNIPPDR